MSEIKTTKVMLAGQEKTIRVMRPVDGVRVALLLGKYIASYPEIWNITSLKDLSSVEGFVQHVVPKLNDSPDDIFKIMGGFLGIDDLTWLQECPTIPELFDALKEAWQLNEFGTLFRRLTPQEPLPVLEEGQLSFEDEEVSQPVGRSQ